MILGPCGPLGQGVGGSVLILFALFPRSRSTLTQAGLVAAWDSDVYCRIMGWVGFKYDFLTEFFLTREL